MNNEKKVKPVLNGTAETMLQCFYARAMHSKNPKNKFHDAKAEELVEKIDYDFSNAKKDTAMTRAPPEPKRPKTDLKKSKKVIRQPPF